MMEEEQWFLLILYMILFINKEKTVPFYIPITGMIFSYNSGRLELGQLEPRHRITNYRYLYNLGRLELRTRFFQPFSMFYFLYNRYNPLYHKIYQSTMGFLSSNHFLCFSVYIIYIIIYIIHITKSTNQPGFISSNRFLCFILIDIIDIIYIIKSTNQPWVFYLFQSFSKFHLLIS